MTTVVSHEEAFPKFELCFSTDTDGTEYDFSVIYGDTDDIEIPGVTLASGNNRDELQESFVKFLATGLTFIMQTETVKPVIPAYSPKEPILGNGGRASASMYADTLRINYGYAGPAHRAETIGRDMYKHYQKWSRINGSK